MANTKISALTAATTPLDGTEVLPIVQSSTTKKVANNDLRPKQIQSNATSGVMQIVGPAAASTRVMTTPDANFTAARTDAAQSFTGDQTLGTGNLIQGTAAKGVNFTANTPAAGMTSQLLNWYEEGTFQPSWSSTGASFTYDTSYRHGTYVRIGRVITFSIYISTSSAPTGTLTNPLTVTGLPFTSANTDNSNTCAVSIGQLWQVVWLAGANAATASVARNSTSVQLRWETSNSNSSSFRADVLNAGAYIMLSGSYFV